MTSGYQKVLKEIWDGIIIEYLRKIGKNLMRCKDNLRAAVLTHWRRHTVFKADASDGRAKPIFSISTIFKHLLKFKWALFKVKYRLLKFK